MVVGPKCYTLFPEMLSRCSELSDLTFPIHPHMLRHACGYKLANDGRDTCAIQHTVRYTELSSDRFKDFWND